MACDSPSPLMMEERLCKEPKEHLHMRLCWHYTFSSIFFGTGKYSWCTTWPTSMKDYIKKQIPRVSAHSILYRPAGNGTLSQTPLSAKQEKIRCTRFGNCYDKIYYAAVTIYCYMQIGITIVWHCKYVENFHMLAPALVEFGKPEKGCNKVVKK